MTRIIQTFTDFGNRKWKDRLEGGKADDKTPEDFPPDDLTIGTKVEREHTSNPDVATEIAMDHLAENPEYYDNLVTSGIADEPGVGDIFDEIKGINARTKAKRDIIDFMEEEDYDEDEEEEGVDDYVEDDLGTDKADIEEDDNELIFDDEEPKNKKEIMENRSIKKYKSFIGEAAEPEVNPAPINEPGPERKYSKENKYKFQLGYDKKIVDKLMEYNFAYYVPDGDKEQSKPTPNSHFIVIDILNLNYSIVDKENPEIRTIDPSRLKHLLENL